ncbi:MAG: glycosyltransferase family 9 protein [Acidobacteriota bacterium]|nr:glycosyltransferase family 9 protein [Acidobacteriota bacterium]
MKRLIIRPGAIGDFIVSLPALQSLRADYTEVWCPSALCALAPFADRAISLAASGIDRVGLTDAPEAIDRLRSFDDIQSWYGTNRPDFRSFVRGLGLPVQFHRALPAAAIQHAADFYLAQVNQPGGAVPMIPLPPVPREDFAVLHPFSGSPKKNWPLARFQEIARCLEQRMPVYWCRGPEDHLPGAVLIPSLFDLAVWLSKARVFIGNDSGITHLAAASGTPTIALFGPTNPIVWAPRGPQCRTIANTSIENITAEQVLKAVP